MRRAGSNGTAKVKPETTSPRPEGVGSTTRVPRIQSSGNRRLNVSLKPAGVGASQVARTRPPSIRHMLRPFQEFARIEAAGGILLMAAAIFALIWANSGWADSYSGLWQTRLTLGMGDVALSKSLLLWINDGLMAIFFFVVGLEIKRELRGGELAEVRKAALPIAAAVGGMVAPAALYLALNAGTAGVSGWGVPVATDIAFALGVLALVGRRVPIALKVFLTALAIVDDIGAVIVIAVFYTADLSWPHLGLGLSVLTALTAANFLGIQRMIVYALLGVVLWLAFLSSGVHATVAGVLLALAIPSRVASGPTSLEDRLRQLTAGSKRASRPEPGPVTSSDGAREPRMVPEARTSLMHQIEHALHPWVTYGVLPLFALANAGVALSGGSALLASLLHPVGLGVLFGLIVGKQVGITLATWAAVRVGIATLPDGITWRHIYGAACLGGIGFTMSIFIAGLAFGESPLLTTAKLAILAASIVSGLLGWLLLRGSRSPTRSVS